MRLKGYQAILILALAAPIAAQADGLDYNYVSVGAIKTNAIETSLSPSTGYLVDVDWELPANILVGADYTHQRFGYSFYSGFHETMRDETFDVGYKFSLSDRVDLAARLVHDSTRITEQGGFPTYNASDSGNGISLELRSMLTDHLELDGGFLHLRQDETSNSLSVGLLYSFTHLFALGSDLTDTTRTYTKYASVSGFIGMHTTAVRLFARFQF
jgi:hypothetical protein